MQLGVRLEVLYIDNCTSKNYLQGYGYLEEIAALYVVMWLQPLSVVIFIDSMIGNNKIQTDLCEDSKQGEPLQNIKSNQTIIGESVL